MGEYYEKKEKIVSDLPRSFSYKLIKLKTEIIITFLHHRHFGWYNETEWPHLNIIFLKA